jgi:serine/threonine protein kinase
MGVAHGMARLHELGICHGNLRTTKVLLDANLVPKIVDIGIAQFREPIRAPHSTAPEFFSAVEHTQKVDVYSYGMLLWEVLTGELSYRGKTSLPIAMGVYRAERPQLPKVRPSGLAWLIERCWAAESE